MVVKFIRIGMYFVTYMCQGKSVKCLIGLQRMLSVFEEMFEVLMVFLFQKGRLKYLGSMFATEWLGTR